MEIVGRAILTLQGKQIVLVVVVVPGLAATFAMWAGDSGEGRKAIFANGQATGGCELLFANAAGAGKNNAGDPAGEKTGPARECGSGERRKHKAGTLLVPTSLYFKSKLIK